MFIVYLGYKSYIDENNINSYQILSNKVLQNIQINKNVWSKTSTASLNLGYLSRSNVFLPFIENQDLQLTKGSTLSNSTAQ